MGGPALTLGLSPTHRGYSRIDTLSKHTLLLILGTDDVLESRSPFKLSCWLLHLRMLVDLLVVGGLRSSCFDVFDLAWILFNSCLDFFILSPPAADHLGFSIVGKVLESFLSSR